MEKQLLSTAFAVSPYVVLFFTFSFLGWCMECVVIRHEKGVWENRGFVHGPFCIIYGFGAMLAYILFQPIADNYILLYIVGALSATAFEFVTAKVMIRLFGTFWWDYTKKPFNYKGIICLESTLAWGIVALVVLGFLHQFLLGGIQSMPPQLCAALSAVLVLGYLADFIVSAHSAAQHSTQEGTEIYDFAQQENHQ